MRLYENLGAGMSGTGPPGTRLERSLSLLGVSGEPSGSLGVQSSSPVAASDLQSRSLSVKQGLDILINGSPIGEDTADGESLLDYNSDSNNEYNVSSAPSQTQAALDVEMNEVIRDQRDVSGTIPGAAKLPCSDAVHLQCRASRLNSF
jgi:hypothetical protein